MEEQDTSLSEMVGDILGETDAIEETEDQDIADEGEQVEDVADAEAADDGEAEGEEGEEEPAIAAPVSWSADDKKIFDGLPRDAQDIIARREAERDKHLRAKTIEASQTEQRVQSEARETFARLQQQHAEQLEVYARQIMPQEPDQRLLYSNDPNDVSTYRRQEAAYRSATAQQQRLHREIAEARQAADIARDQAHQAEQASDAQRLHEQLPEWFDPSEGPKLRQQLQSIGSELGYPVELMADASSTDIIALKTAGEWKAKAEKYDQLMKNKMQAVRSAKDLPKMVKPGVKPGMKQASATATQAAFERAKSDPRQAADWLEKVGFL